MNLARVFCFPFCGVDVNAFVEEVVVVQLAVDGEVVQAVIGVLNVEDTFSSVIPVALEDGSVCRSLNGDVVVEFPATSK